MPASGSRRCKKRHSTASDDDSACWLSSALLRCAAIVITEFIMNNNSHRAAALPVLLALVLFGASSRAELPEDPTELLKRLKAKDARFDNVHVYYIRRGEYTPEPFPYWKFPGQEQSDEPSEPLSFRFKEQMMCRGRESTFERDVHTKFSCRPTRKPRSYPTRSGAMQAV